jgi:CRISPR/Cas system-associated exonuclease Cas4 (RecB family)
MTRQIFLHAATDIGYDELQVVTGEAGRRYVTPQGISYPSITTVLGALGKDWLRAWRAAVGEEEAARVSRHAASRGTSLHSITERYLGNCTEWFAEHEMPHCKALFNSIKPVLDTRIGTILLQEKPLYSNYLKVAGRVDLIADFDGKKSVIDFKTSSRRKTKEEIQNYFMQAAAYAIMFEERTQIPVAQLVIIMAVDGDPEPLVFVEKRDSHTKALLSAIEKYNTQKLFGHC